MRNVSQTPTETQNLTSPVLRRDFGLWRLNYLGQEAVLKNEIGLSYVAFLLDHPNEEFHGLALALKVRAVRNGQPADSAELIQERALALDDAEAARRLYRKQLQLEALVDEEATSDPVREKAQRELAAIYAFKKKNVSRTNTMASKASHSVGMAIKRLHKRLATAVDDAGHLHSILSAFAHYIQQHILIPSGRMLCHGGTRLGGQGGHFTYIPSRHSSYNGSPRNFPQKRIMQKLSTL